MNIPQLQMMRSPCNQWQKRAGMCPHVVRCQVAEAVQILKQAQADKGLTSRVLYT